MTQRAYPFSSRPNIGALPMLTASLWTTIAAVGAAGLWFGHPTPAEKTSEPPPIVMTPVMIATGDSAPAAVPATAEPSATPAIDPLPAVPIAPSIPAIAEAAKFDDVRPAALMKPSSPLKSSPTRPAVKAAAPANVAAATTARPSAPMTPTRLVLGEGPARQPAPEYPPEAVLNRQQGTVVVDYTVNADGTVANVPVVSSSGFALLDQSAVRTIRDRWPYPAGPVRLFEVPIEFSLREQ